MPFFAQITALADAGFWHIMGIFSQISGVLKKRLLEIIQ